MIAYSSIAHAGYLFYALLGDGAGRFQAVAFYLLAYGLMNLLAFAALPAADDDVGARSPRQPEGAVPSRPVRRADARHRHAVAGRHSAVPGLRRQVPDLQERRWPPATRRTRCSASSAATSASTSTCACIQFMFMSPDAPIAGAAPRRGLALGRERGCLAGAVLIAVFPGWVIAGF